MWLFVTVGVIVGMIVSAVVRAYVIAQLWGWYIVPALNVPAISLSTAFGFSLFASLFLPLPQTPNTQGKDRAEITGELIGLFIGQLIGYVFVLIIGGWVHDVASRP